MSTFSMSVDLSGLDAMLDGAAAAVEEAVRPAAQAGAQVLYDRVVQNVPVSGKGHFFHGTSFKINGKKYFFESGSLKRAIYQVYSKDHSGPALAQYQVSWNHKKVPYGVMVEYGTVKTRAHSFVRAAGASHGEIARQAMKTGYLAELAAKGVVK